MSSGANTQLALPSASPSGPLRGGRAGSAFWNAAQRVRPKRRPAGAAPAAVTAKAHRTPGGHRTPESYLSHRQRSPCAANPPGHGHGHGHGHGQCRDSRPARKWDSPMDRALTLPWAPQGRARPENGPALPGAAPRTGRWPMPIWVKVKDDLALTREDPKPCRAETQTRRRARGRQAEPQTRDPAASKGPGRQAEMSEVGSRQGGGGGAGRAGGHSALQGPCGDCEGGGTQPAGKCPGHLAHPPHANGQVAWWSLPSWRWGWPEGHIPAHPAPRERESWRHRNPVPVGSLSSERCTGALDTQGSWWGPLAIRCYKNTQKIQQQPQQPPATRRSLGHGPRRSSVFLDRWTVSGGQGTPSFRRGMEEQIRSLAGAASHRAEHEAGKWPGQGQGGTSGPAQPSARSPYLGLGE